MATPNPEQRVIASRLREARETLGLTQGDVATAIGIQRTSVVDLEAGKRNVTGLELRRLSRLYRRSVAWLLGEPEQPPDTELDALTAGLHGTDREAVLRFAQFLAAQTGGPR